MEKNIKNLEMLGYIFLFSRIIVSAFYNVGVSALKTNANIGSNDVAFYSSIFGVLFLFVLYPFREKIFGNKKTGMKPIPFILASLFGGAFYIICYNTAQGLLPIGKVSTTYYIYPVFFYILGSVIIDKDIKKAFDPKILLGIVMCLLGLFFTCYGEIVNPSKATNPEGYLWVAGAVISIIIFSLIVKKYPIDTYWFLLTGQVLSFSIAIITYISKGNGTIGVPHVSGLVLLILAIFGILANDLREFFRIKSIEYLPISKISTWNYFSPLSTTLTGFLFLGQAPTKYDYLGYFLIISGNIVANYKPKTPTLQTKTLKQKSYRTLKV